MHYVHDEKNNRIEALSKEEIYALLALAIQEGQLPSVDEDTAFVTMIKSTTDGVAYKQAYCTQATYNALEAAGQLEANTVYYITDDTSYDDLVTAIQNIVDGTTKVDAASKADNAYKINGLGISLANSLLQWVADGATKPNIIPHKLNIFHSDTPQLILQDWDVTRWNLYGDGIYEIHGFILDEDSTAPYTYTDEPIIAKLKLYTVSNTLRNVGLNSTHKVIAIGTSDTLIERYPRMMITQGLGTTFSNIEVTLNVDTKTITKSQSIGIFVTDIYKIFE